MSYKSLYRTDPRDEQEGEGLEIEVVTEPTIQPVTLAELKLFCKIDHDDEDDLLASLIKAARREAERYANQSFTSQRLRAQWERMLDYVILPLPPHREIVSVESYDGEDWIALTTSQYKTVGLKRFKVKTSVQYTSTRYIEQPFRVTYDAGPEDASEDTVFDERAQAAIKEMVLVAYENRGQAKTEDGAVLEGLLTPVAKQLLDGLTDFS